MSILEHIRVLGIWGLEVRRLSITDLVPYTVHCLVLGPHLWVFFNLFLLWVSLIEGSLYKKKKSDNNQGFFAGATCCTLPVSQYFSALAKVFRFRSISITDQRPSVSTSVHHTSINTTGLFALFCWRLFCRITLQICLLNLNKQTSRLKCLHKHLSNKSMTPESSSVGAAPSRTSFPNDKS